jgi:hypothetical protein
VKPQVDALGDGNGLGDSGDYDGGRSWRWQVCEFGVLGEEQQVGLGGEAEADIGVGQAP